jgi:hypothetical protein
MNIYVKPNIIGSHSLLGMVLSQTTAVDPTSTVFFPEEIFLHNTQNLLNEEWRYINEDIHWLAQQGCLTHIVNAENAVEKFHRLLKAHNCHYYLEKGWTVIDQPADELQMAYVVHLPSFVKFVNPGHLNLCNLETMDE